MREKTTFSHVLLRVVAGDWCHGMAKRGRYAKNPGFRILGLISPHQGVLIAQVFVILACTSRDDVEEPPGNHPRSSRKASLPTCTGIAAKISHKHTHKFPTRPVGSISHASPLLRSASVSLSLAIARRTWKRFSPEFPSGPIGT